ncbi:thiamine phosphate synthase [Bacillus tianshenii]|nr:thiamine phosphate synthase [Bacillus tianshenii]
MKREDLKLYFIMGSNNCFQDPVHVLEEAIRGGITCFQFREKGKGAYTGTEKEEFAKVLQKICRQSGIPFIVNDDVDLAERINADGVHVGQDDKHITYVRKQFQGKIVGLSVHNEEEAQEAVAQSVDYIGLGPIYTTSSKEDAKAAVGPGTVQSFRNKAINIPLVAIGGINEANVIEVMEAGADGVSVISAISKASSPFEAANQLKMKLERVKQLPR